MRGVTVIGNRDTAFYMIKRFSTVKPKLSHLIKDYPAVPSLLKSHPMRGELFPIGLASNSESVLAILSYRDCSVGMFSVKRFCRISEFT